LPSLESAIRWSHLGPSPTLPAYAAGSSPGKANVGYLEEERLAVFATALRAQLPESLSGDKFDVFA
jgi:hypothetical protein